jgi:hypothetical protein
MRRVIVLMVCVGLVAACGGDTAGDETTTTAASTTTVAAVTTSSQPETTTTTAGTSSERIAMAEALVGAYGGDWFNTTFGSTGTATAEVTLDGTTVTVTMELGGNVFGVGTTDPVVLVFDVASEPPYEIASGLFGDAVIDFAQNGTLTFTFEAANLPSLGMSFKGEGLAHGGGIQLDYQIHNGETLFAEGFVGMPRA